MAVLPYLHCHRHKQAMICALVQGWLQILCGRKQQYYPAPRLFRSYGLSRHLQRLQKFPQRFHTLPQRFQSYSQRFHTLQKRLQYLLLHFLSNHEGQISSRDASMVKTLTTENRLLWKKTTNKDDIMFSSCLFVAWEGYLPKPDVQQHQIMTTYRQNQSTCH